MKESTRHKGKLSHIIYPTPLTPLFWFWKMKRKFQKLSSLMIILQTVYYNLIIQLSLCAQHWTANNDFPNSHIVKLHCTKWGKSILTFCNESFIWISHQNRPFQLHIFPIPFSVNPCMKQFKRLILARAKKATENLRTVSNITAASWSCPV